MAKFIGSLLQMPSTPLPRKKVKMIAALATILPILSMLAGAAVAAVQNGLF